MATDYGWKSPTSEKLVSYRSLGAGASGVLVSTGLYYGLNHKVGMSNKVSAIFSYSATIVGGYFVEDQILRKNSTAKGASIVDMVFIGLGAGFSQTFLCVPKKDSRVVFYPSGNMLKLSYRF